MVYSTLHFTITPSRRRSNRCFYFTSLLAYVLRFWSISEALCPPGFRPPDCLHQCPRGQYGLGCASQCPITCYTPTCRPDSGNCFRCMLGFRGHRCKTKCSVGRYGQDCMHWCGENCLGQVCDAFTGACIGCEPGFFGTRCDQVGPMAQKSALIKTLLSDLWQSTNNTDSLNALVKLVANTRYQKAVGDDERQAFFTSVFLVCSVLPICLVGACLYMLKEKIQNLYGGLLSKKRWVRTRDGFFTRTVIPTSKSHLIRRQSKDRLKEPFVKLISKDNVGSIHEKESQTEQSGNQRFVSSMVSETNKNQQMKSLVASAMEMHLPNSRLSSSKIQMPLGDENRQHKAIQSEDSAWTADINTSVPVGQQDPHQGGFSIRPEGFWRRIFHKMTRKRNKKSNELDTAKSGKEIPASELFMNQAVSSPAEVTLEAATESSSSSGQNSSESSTDASATTNPTEDENLMQDIGCNTEQTLPMRTSPTRKRQWSPVNLAKLLGVVKSAKKPAPTGLPDSHHILDESYIPFANLRSTRLGSQTAAAGYGDQYPERVPREGAQFVAKNSPQTSEEGKKLFELLKSNIVQELRLLQSADKTNISPIKSVSDHVIAKSSQTPRTKFAGDPLFDGRKADCRESIYPNNYRESCFRRGINPQLLQELRHGPPEFVKEQLSAKRHHESEDAKSVASTSKMMTLKLKMARIFGRFMKRKSEGYMLSRLSTDSTDPAIFHEIYKMNLKRKPSYKPECGRNGHLLQDICSKVYDQNLAVTPGECYGDLSTRLGNHQEKHVQTDLFTSKPFHPTVESKAGGDLPQQKPIQREEVVAKLHLDSPFGVLEDLKCLKSHPTNFGNRPSTVENLASLLDLKTLDANINFPQKPNLIKNENRHSQFNQNKDAPVFVDVSTSPYHNVGKSHQTSQIGKDSSFPVNNIFASPIKNRVHGAVNASTSTGLNNYQVSTELFPSQNVNQKDQIPVPPKLCERGHSPGSVVFAGVDKRKTTGLTNNQKGKVSSIDVSLMEPVGGNNKDIELAREKMDTLKVSQVSQNLAEKEVSSHDLLARAGNKYADDPKESVQIESETDKHNMTKKVCWGKRNYADGALNTSVGGEHCFREPKTSGVSQTDLRIHAREKAVPTQRPGLNDQFQRTRDVPQQQAPLTGTEVINADCVPIKILSSRRTQQNQVPVWYPYVAITGGLSVQGDVVKKKCTDVQTIRDVKPVVTSIMTSSTQPTVCVGPSNFRHAPMSPEPSNVEAVQISSRGNENLQQSRLPMKFKLIAHSEGVSRTQNKWDGLDSTSGIIQTEKISERGNPHLMSTRRSTPKSSPKLSGIPPAADRGNHSLETMTSSESKIGMSSTNDSHCIVVHAFESSMNSALEKSDRSKQTDCEPSREKQSAVRSESAEKSQLDNAKLHLKPSEDSIFRSISSDWINEKTAPAVVSKMIRAHPIRSSHANSGGVNTEIIEISDTKRSSSLRELTSSSQGETLWDCPTLTAHQEDVANLMTLDILQKPLAQNYPIKRKESLSPKRKMSTPIAKSRERSEGKTTASTVMKSLPVPTLLEHSLKPEGKLTSLEVNKRCPRSKQSSTSETVSVEMATPYVSLLRDNEEFRSVHEPSSERFYDALEPDSSFWTGLHHGVKSPCLRQPSFMTHSSKTFKPLARSASARRPQVESKPSEQGKALSQTVFRFATLDSEVAAFSEKGKGHHHKEQEKSGTDIVFRFAHPFKEPKAVSSNDRHRRSNSCKGMAVERKNNSHSHDSRRNNSVGPDFKRKKHATEDRPNSEKRPRQQRENVDIVLSTDSSSNASLQKSSSLKQQTSFKEIVRIEKGVKASTMSNPKIVISTCQSNHMTPAVDSSGHANSPEQCQPRSDVHISSKTSCHWPQTSQEQSYPNGAGYRTESLHPQFYTSRFPQPVMATSRLASSLGYTQPPLHCSENYGSYNHNCPGVRQVSHPEPYPSYLIPIQNMVPERPSVQNSAPAIAYNLSQPDLNRSVFGSSNLQSQAIPFTMVCPPVLSTAPSKSYVQSVKQGSTFANNFILSQPGVTANPQCGIQIGPDSRAVHNPQGGYVLLPYGARMPSSGGPQASVEAAVSFPAQLHPSSGQGKCLNFGL